jgi:tRNA pseudouridine synthase 10
MINQDTILHYKNRILKKLKNFEFNTFLIGVVSGGEKNDELEKPFKKSLGKILEEKLNKKVDFKNPDILILIDTKTKKINYQIKPLYIFGRYQKLVAGIPQTKWKRKKFKTSVQEEIGETLLKITGGSNHSFHGCGREDIDVITVGEGRPFVLEIINPKIRTFDLKKAEKEINKKSKFVKVKNLSLTNKEKIKEIKLAAPDKIYEAEVDLEKETSKKELENACHLLSNIVVNQQTPTRVLRRRYDLLRKKKVYYFKLKKFSPKNPVFEIKTESGTYIKELINGDNGRTKPSLSEILKQKAEVKKLVVKKILI